LSTYQAEPNPAATRPLPKWLLPLVFLGGLLGFVLITGRSEISRWHFAATKNAIIDKRYDDAVASANKGLNWNPDYSDLLQLRAMAHAGQKDFASCLIDYDRIIEIESKVDPYCDAVHEAKSAKTSVLQRMDRFDEAIALWDEVVNYRAEQYRLRDDDSSQYAYAMSLNNRAYVAAQGFVAGNEQIDVETSLREIEKAIEVRGVEDDPVMIDTLGYLQLLNGKNEEALYQLDMAVELTKQENAIRRQQYQQAMSQVVDQRPYQDAIEQLDQQFSIILHHRGEARRAMGMTEEADEDIKQALELGYDPDEGVW
jgi:tetratricopeptide (TPR) repeat protein